MLLILEIDKAGDKVLLSDNYQGESNYSRLRKISNIIYAMCFMVPIAVIIVILV